MDGPRTLCRGALRSLDLCLVPGKPPKEQCKAKINSENS